MKPAQAVLRIEGGNIFPFTANNLNIFVSALVDLLPNITASDIVIGQVRDPYSEMLHEIQCPDLLYWMLRRERSLQHSQLHNEQYQRSILCAASLLCNCKSCERVLCRLHMPLGGAEPDSLSPQ